MTTVWTAEARRSLKAIRRYIAQDSKFYAARLVSRIIDRVEQAAAEPLQGHIVHEYPEKPLREVHESPYRIIYALSGSDLQVITIVHFKQQLAKTRLTRPSPKEPGR